MATGQTPQCDPRHLEDKELEVEYEVRNIQGRDSAALMTLVRTMRDEENGVVLLPIKPHSFVDVEELTNIKSISENIHNAMLAVVEKPDWSRAEIIRSRLVHVYRRFDRFRRACPTNIHIEQLNNDVQLLIRDEQNLRDFLVRSIVESAPQAVAGSRSLVTGGQLLSNPDVNPTGPPAQNPIPEPPQNVQQTASILPLPPSLSSQFSTGARAQFHQFTTTNIFSQPPPNIQGSQFQFPNISSGTGQSAAASRPLVSPANPDQIFTSDRNANPFPTASSWGLQAQRPVCAQVPVPIDGGHFRSAGSVMSKWTTKFSGGSRDMTADEFIFRVEDMAQSSHLNVDDMSRSIHVLLSSRAEEWFWGFRRKQRDCSWLQFRTAFLNKFATRDTDEEIRSMMSQRTQLIGERFDDFCRAVETMSYRLRDALPDANMVALLKANADPKLRSVLQMHNINSVDALQDVAMSYEDLWIRQGIWRRGHRHVNEISEMYPQPLQQPLNFPQGQSLQNNIFSQTHPVPYHEAEQQIISSTDTIIGTHPAIDAMQGGRQVDFICWNCDERGHCYQDCEIATRNVFCYGCGAKNVYRPQCARCALNSKRRGTTGPSFSGNPFASGPSTQSHPIQLQRPPTANQK